MKQAAEGLAKIVVWKDGNTYNSRVALVPFSRAVKTGLLSTSILKGNKATKTLLTSTLDSIQATGNTVGQFGPPWAWYNLSPNWNSVFSTASEANPYSLLSQLNRKGKPLLEKIAVLMTDGKHNSQ